MKAGYLIIIFAAFTAACTPRFYPPRVSVPDDYIYGRGFSEDTTRFGPEWWTLFGDTVLNNLVARALDNNRDVAVAASRVEEARLNLKSVRAQYLPQVGLGVTAEGEYTPATKIVQSYAVEPSLSWEVALFGQLVAGGLMGLLNVPEDVYPLALSYLRIYLLGMPVILLYNFEAAIFRSIGDTKMPLAALTVSGILNVILNLFFVIVLKMNVNGVAIATVLSNAVSSVLLLRRLLHGDLVRVELRELRIDRNAFNKIMRIGLPAGIQTAIFSLSNIIIQSAINSLGTVVMAASSAAFNIEIIAYDVLNSFSQACTTFVGQNYGAGKIDRCKKTMFLCLIEDFIASAAAIALVLLTGKYILAIFNSDPEVIAIGYTRLLFLFGSYIFTLTYEILSGYLRGFGISLAPAILTLFGVCGVRIFWIKAIFPMHRTFQSILLAYPVSLATTTVLIIAALLICRPAHKFAARSGEQTQA